jgi:hypothetical protein
VFQLADFGFSDALDSLGAQGVPSAFQENNFTAVIIGALPQAGCLTLNGAAVTSGKPAHFGRYRLEPRISQRST